MVATDTLRRLGSQYRAMTDAEARSDADAQGDADGDGRLFELTRDKLLVAALLLVGIAGSGLARRGLGELGYNDLGALVYILGYGGMVVAIWYGWIRPMDLTGPE
jgi:hypothetical protein